jgi:hypothetical protein
LRECVDYNRRHLTDAIFRNGILQLKWCFEIKLNLTINSLKKIVHFSFYFNLKIVTYFCRTLYVHNNLSLRVVISHFPMVYVTTSGWIKLIPPAHVAYFSCFLLDI